MYSSDNNDPLKKHSANSGGNKLNDGHGSWVTISRVYPPNDLIIESLLRYYGIPVKICRKEIPQLPMSAGPMAEVLIAVPEEMVEDARDLLENRPTEP